MEIEEGSVVKLRAKPDVGSTYKVLKVDGRRVTFNKQSKDGDTTTLDRDKLKQLS